MTIYADAIWILNLGMDSLLLWMTALFLKRKVKIWRIVAGGFVGSLIVVFSFFPLLEWTQSIPSKISISFLMILVTFGRSRVKTFWKRLVTFYLATFISGGALLGVHYLINFDFSLQAAYYVANQKGFGDPVSWLFILLALPLVWFFSTSTIRSLETTKLDHTRKYEWKVRIADLTLTGTGLLDTGNKVSDPVSGTPVVFLSLSPCKDVPPSFLQWVNQEEEQLQHVEELSDEWKDRIRMVPATSLGKQNQLLIGFKADSMQLFTEDAFYHVKRVLIVFTARSLSADREFDSILHQKLFQEATKLEEQNSVAT